MPCFTMRFAKILKTHWKSRNSIGIKRLEDLDALTENARAYKDAALILKLIKDNISMWQIVHFCPRGRLVKDEENKKFTGRDGR